MGGCLLIDLVLCGLAVNSVVLGLLYGYLRVTLMLDLLDGVCLVF